MAAQADKLGLTQNIRRRSICWCKKKEKMGIRSKKPYKTISKNPVFFKVFGPMESYQKKMGCLLAICLFIIGCGQPVQVEELTKIDVDTTIGSLVEVYSFGSIPVSGYALVAGLRGTGSPQCPPSIRAYLEQYILGKVPDTDIENSSTATTQPWSQSMVLYRL